jgi:uncharacterized Zn finger protein
MSWGYEWRPYVSVAQRRAQALAYATKLAKKEKRALCPVQITSRTIASTFWGRAWCDNLEQYSDFANRLPRGRTYARNGSVVDLQIEAGRVRAIVGGSEVYKVRVSIKTLAKPIWTRVKRDCAQGIDSLIDLLQGRFDDGVMKRLTHPEGGLFPRPKEIDMDCSCPDWAVLCKHVAAVLYAVAARLDTEPQLLFTLRDVDHTELISQAVAAENLERSLSAGADNALAGSNLDELFGIEIDRSQQPAEEITPKRRAPVRAAAPTVENKSNERPAARTRTKKPKPLAKSTPVPKSRKKTSRKPAKSKMRPKTRKARQPA